MSEHRVHFTVKLARWHRQTIYLSVGALWVTGAAWLVFDTWVRIAGAFGPEHHPAQPWILAPHGVSAYAFLILAGALIPVHIRLAWLARSNRATGLVIGSLGLGLSITGALLYYASGEALRAATSLAHWAVGLSVPLVLAAHILAGRGVWRRFRRRVAAVGPTPRLHRDAQD